MFNHLNLPKCSENVVHPNKTTTKTWHFKTKKNIHGKGSSIAERPERCTCTSSQTPEFNWSLPWLTKNYLPSSFSYLFFRSRGPVRVQADKIPLGNQRTDCSLDLFLDSTEINSLATLENGILLTVSLFWRSLPRPNTVQFARTLRPSGLILGFLSAPEPKWTIDLAVSSYD